MIESCIGDSLVAWKVAGIFELAATDLKVLNRNTMERKSRQIRLWFSIPFVTVTMLVSSCYSLKPVVQNNSLQILTGNNLNQLNGDYEIFSVDSSFRTLSFVLSSTDKFNFESLPKTNDRINLLSIDPTHVKVTVYRDDKVLKTKILKGQVSQNYFQFKLIHIGFRLILNGYETQTSRIGLLKGGDLTLDTKDGGFLFLVVMPTFGDGAEFYNLVFKRRTSGS